MADAPKTDIVDRLLAAADEIDGFDRAKLQVLLRQAAVDIRTLRMLIGIRDEVWLESADPEGHG
jgi:hypothetical protein